MLDKHTLSINSQLVQAECVDAKTKRSIPIGVTMEDLKGLDEYGTDAALAAVNLFDGYPETLLHFATACCIIFMVIGIPGNIVTIIALARCKKVRNATALFIINLSLADLLFCCFNLPLAASTFSLHTWTHGIVLCRLFPLARYSLVAISLFTVLSITINRYILISHPTLYPKIYKNRYIYIMIAVIWTISFGAFILTYLELWGQFSLDPLTSSCTIIPKDGKSPKKVLFIVAFLIPSVAIIACYARILWIVRKTAKKSKAQPVRMRPITEIEVTNTDIPETTLPTVQVETEQRKEKARMNVPCFYTPEFSSSCNESTSRDDIIGRKAPEFTGSPLASESAKRIRKSFIATFRKSTAYIKPRMPTKKDKKLLTMIVAIITAFCVCHLPITLTKTISQEYMNHPYANIIGYILIYMTPCINPIIYVVMSSEYRQAYKNCLHWQCQR